MIITWFNKTYISLAKTREKLVEIIGNFTGKTALVSKDYEILEEALLQADLGWGIVDSIIEKLKAPDSKNIPMDERIINCLTDKLSDFESKRSFEKVIYIVGVNGSGKTTSAAKLAAYFSKRGENVMLVAADTYRAGAIDQIKIWSKQLGVKLIANHKSTDPSSIIYNGIQSGLANDFDRIIVDTAGRMHTSKNLMLELEKMYRVGMKETANIDVLLTIDANIGQNGINQANSFNNHIKLTGIVLTKMDGTAKGGIAIPIMTDIKLPIDFIGMGEKIDDFIPFNLENYLFGIIGHHEKLQT